MLQPMSSMCSVAVPRVVHSRATVAGEVVNAGDTHPRSPSAGAKLSTRFADSVVSSARILLSYATGRVVIADDTCSRPAAGTMLKIRPADSVVPSALVISLHAAGRVVIAGDTYPGPAAGTNTGYGVQSRAGGPDRPMNGAAVFTRSGKPLPVGSYYSIVCGYVYMR
jgi:hypothetical protein